MSNAFGSNLPPIRHESGLTLRQWVWITHLLYAASFFTVITHIPGVIVAYLKIGEARGTPYESHFIYAVRSFWLGIALLFLGLILAIVGVGILILALWGVWWFIRIIRPIMALLDDRPIADPYGLI
ncbi:DUF4870 family protein [Acidomonas methanolica]|uniref:DUF4870 family protein n=1 Tax=Acidomonas methanolica TaxID=437 RepID=UPI002119BDAB|nr:hypothetical protein [Acidomonas methanolica]MCQ9155453.1 hypothetical protein [Acidomonas methanolica]